MHNYEVIIYWSNEDQLFIADASKLHGCITHGDEQKTALRNVKEAMQFWIERAQEAGWPVPQPNCCARLGTRDGDICGRLDCAISTRVSSYHSYSPSPPVN